MNKAINNKSLSTLTFFLALISLGIGIGDLFFLKNWSIAFPKYAVHSMGVDLWRILAITPLLLLHGFILRNKAIKFFAIWFGTIIFTLYFNICNFPGGGTLIYMLLYCVELGLGIWILLTTNIRKNIKEYSDWVELKSSSIDMTLFFVLAGLLLVETALFLFKGTASISVTGSNAIIFLILNLTLILPILYSMAMQWLKKQKNLYFKTLVLMVFSMLKGLSILFFELHVIYKSLPFYNRLGYILNGGKVYYNLFDFICYGGMVLVSGYFLTKFLRNYSKH